eukprot:TRINITY_DN1939_c0_g2_i1.p1 TRINITY_DN1939_c0_g2~~TRINITY_DN1939_c0_g2_i1.p1  ORF type:complete len:774 (+),score=120.79 TRINITY_DN1939_c0_g2_i1:41-2362(+)
MVKCVLVEGIPKSNEVKQKARVKRHFTERRIQVRSIKTASNRKLHIELVDEQSYLLLLSLNNTIVLQHRIQVTDLGEARRAPKRVRRWENNRRQQRGEDPESDRLSFERGLGRYPNTLDFPEKRESLKNFLNKINPSDRVFLQKLSPSEMAVFYSGLFEIEEKKMLVDLHSYDLETTLALHRTNHSLVEIHVPGLAEKRPSVLRGDNVRVCIDPEDPTEVEQVGVVFFVNLDNIHVSFHLAFIDRIVRNPNVVYQVRFTLNRNPLQVMHRAIDDMKLSVRLFKSIFAQAVPVKNNPKSHKNGKSPAPRLPYSLNQKQNEAVATVFNEREKGTIVLEGPPGTGKTQTCVAIIYALFHSRPSSRVLVCAPSNVAADLLCERLAYAGIRTSSMLRLNARKRDPKLILSRVVEGYCAARYNSSYTIPDSATLRGYRIIITTCISAGFLVSRCLYNFFSHILVDEAGQAFVPETFVALSLASPDTKIILAGDSKQLGPIVRSREGLHWKLDHSLLEHLSHSPVTKIHLVNSYRAHPEITRLYSSLFYSGLLKSVADQKITNSLMNWPRLEGAPLPAVFRHIEGVEGQDPDSPSWYNQMEIEAVKQEINCLLEWSAISPGEIGIIAPYRKQVQKIRSWIHSEREQRPELGRICVGTTENFQGKEMKVIVMTMVRSNAVYLPQDAKFQLGFCTCPKRTNVAISRARSLLIIVGNSLLFSKHNENWRWIIQQIAIRGAFDGPISVYEELLDQNKQLPVIRPPLSVLSEVEEVNDTDWPELL